MSDTKFTPGPWEYDDSGYLDRDGGRCIMKENLCIATAAWDMEKPRDANAHLIAAAPDLYEALEHFRKAFVIAVGDKSPFARIALSRVDAALAKAEGKS